jgi:hypothetical protein
LGIAAIDHLVSTGLLSCRPVGAAGLHGAVELAVESTRPPG